MKKNVAFATDNLLNGINWLLNKSDPLKTLISLSLNKPNKVGLFDHSFWKNHIIGGQLDPPAFLGLNLNKLWMDG